AGPARSMIRPALREAVKRREFFYEYQPIVTVADSRITGYEALARWRHAGGIVPPSDFIWIAEQSGAMADIQTNGLIGWAAAVAATSESITFAVNWSPLQLARSAEIAGFINLTARLGVPATRIVIEITEESLLQPSAATLANVGHLKDAGFAIALDDFGTGCCNLAYLKDLPVDRLKIDRSFVRALPYSAKSRAIVEAVIELAHRLHIEVVAEGVENEQQLTQLAAMHCDYVQGYLLGRPSHHAQISAQCAAALLPAAEPLQ